MIAQTYQNVITSLGNLIDNRMQADGPPPRTLLKFFKWALGGAWRVIFLAAFISAFAGATEVLAMYLLGRVVDIAASSQPIGDSAGLLVLAVALLMFMRPALFGVRRRFNRW